MMRSKSGIKISRKSFLKTGAGAALSLAMPFNILSTGSQSNPTIAKITVLTIPGEFNRPVAMNAYDVAPKGKTGSREIIRVILNDGTQGIGVVGYSSIDEKTIKSLQKMIGVSLEELYDWENGHITGFSSEYRDFFRDPAFAFFENPILDALGKVRSKPVWQLFGPKIRSHVDCYDGTLYFKDVELDTGVSVLGELAQRIKEDGYKAIKMKLGRPYKWVKGEAGVKRDIEAFIAVREAVGYNFNIMADANNGYEKNFDWAVRMLTECAPYEMYWMEEIFPESIKIYRRLHAAMNKSNVKIPIAEGEGVRDVAQFQPYLEEKMFNIIQPDMRTVGFSNILRGARIADEHGVSLIPHNWASEIGKLMSIHAAMIQKNITFAEDDRYHTLAIDASGYLFRDGQWTAPDEPGWGFQLNDHYDYFQRNNEELVIS